MHSTFKVIACNVLARMPEFGVEPQRLIVFKLDDQYIFKQYFEQQSLFTALQEYYNRDTYRFEVPHDEFATVRDQLEDYYYEPIIIADDDLATFCVVKEQYTPYKAILRNAVEHWTRDDHNFFLMKDRLSVDQAVEHGATRLTETDFVPGL